MRSKSDLSPKWKTIHSTSPSSLLHGSSSQQLVLPRSREIYRHNFSDEGSPENVVDVVVSGDEVRRAICRESQERVAEKSTHWKNLQQERDAQLLARIEAEAKESALARIQTENLVNAQYRLQRQQRELAREKRRLAVEAMERSHGQTPPAGTDSGQGSAVSPPAGNAKEEASSVSRQEPAKERTIAAVSAPEIEQNKIVVYLEELRKTTQNLSHSISSLPPAEAPTAGDTLKEIHRRYRQVCQQAGSLASALASEEALATDITKDLLDCVQDTKKLILLVESERDRLRAEEEKRKQADQLAVESELKKEEERKQSGQLTMGLEMEEPAPVTIAVPKEAVAVSPTEHAQQIYETYAIKAKQAKSAFTQLETDPSLKTLKSAVLFASSNPVVICSANSPMEIIEPYRKAFLLLRGAEVETSSLRIRLADHPDIVHYVRYNMAKKFIDLACMQTEEKNEIKLFALATLITELWSCDPEFGETFLALLFTEYPVLIPFYGKASLKTEGNVDLQLKRLAALSKFYAAIMQTDRTIFLRRLFPTKQFEGKNPHGVEAGWDLLSGLVNQDVQLTTVYVLRNILSVAGWLLKKTYDKQFTKMMVHISRHVLPKIREKTPKELHGPVERLAELLDVFHRTLTVPVPENRLSEEFWML